MLDGLDASHDVTRTVCKRHVASIEVREHELSARGKAVVPNRIRADVPFAQALHAPAQTPGSAADVHEATSTNASLRQRRYNGVVNYCGAGAGTQTGALFYVELSQ